MITGQETNAVYFSNIIRTDTRYRRAFERIQSILEKHHIRYKFLDNTKDIWCRDYMPIQISQNKYVQFRYEPSYLKRYNQYQSDPIEVLKSNGLTADFSTINLDGGNVVNWTDRAILTSRVFNENPDWDRAQLLNELEIKLNSKIYTIPDISDDMTGHVDGHLRFIDANTILVNELKNELPDWTNGFKKMIKNSGLNFVEIPWFEPTGRHPKHSAIGYYVNYLEIGNLILFPIFEISSNKDDEALNVIRQVFPKRTIEPVNVNEIGRDGGLLNCSTWTVKT